MVTHRAFFLPWSEKPFNLALPPLLTNQNGTIYLLTRDSVSSHVNACIETIFLGLAGPLTKVKCSMLAIKIKCTLMLNYFLLGIYLNHLSPSRFSNSNRCQIRPLIHFQYSLPSSISLLQMCVMWYQKQNRKTQWTPKQNTPNPASLHQLCSFHRTMYFGVIHGEVPSTENQPPLRRSLNSACFEQSWSPDLLQSITT